MKIVLISIFVFIVQCTYGFPRTNRNVDSIKSKNLAGVSSQIIATNILKDKIDYNGNQVFSPLGISTLLAILAEGARDDVYKEFVTTLGYPDDKQALRESFKDVLKNFRQDLNQLHSPSFKTWFYIYRNNTVREEFKQILRDYYFVEVKDVDRYLYNWDESKSLSNQKLSETLPLSSSTVVPSSSSSSSSLSFELETQTSPSSTVLIPTSTSVNSKDIVEFDVLKKTKPFDETKRDVEEQKDASKFDEVVEDKQYVEVPVIKEEISIKENQNQELKNVERIMDEKEKVEIERKKEDEKQQESVNVINQNVSDKKKEKFIRDDKNDNDNDKQEMKEMIKPNAITEDTQIHPLVMVAELELSEPASSSSSSSGSFGEQNLQDNEAIKDDEKLEAYKKDVEVKQPAVVQVSNEPEKFSIPLKKLEESEIIQALENHFLKKRFSGGRALFQKDDIASALSANSLVGRELPAQTRMLLFNGLYYRGNWAYPFQLSKSGENDNDDDLFYVNEDKKIPVMMMKAEGKYRIADLERLNAKAIEFPYENQKYSLLILLPKENQELRSLIEGFEASDLLLAKSRLAESPVKVCLPRFSTELTSRSEATLKRLGLKTLFSPDLGGLENISEGLQLNVDEIVQHVNLRVDEGAGSQNVLAATALESRSSQPSNTAESIIDEESGKPIKDDIKEMIKINRPFLYFILDNENDFIIIAGKIFEPKISLDDFQ